MSTSAKLPKSWPRSAREILLDAARYYYREMKSQWPVPDVIMERAVEQANRQLDERSREIREEASPRWIDRWESGQLDAEMSRTIEETYRRMSRAERVIRPRKKTTRKSVTNAATKRRRLEADIAESLAKIR